jgi:hypothetical protein
MFGKGSYKTKWFDSFFHEEWLQDSIETLGEEHPVRERKMPKEKNSQSNNSWLTVTFKNCFTSILPHFVPRNSKLNTMSAVVSDAYVPWHSGFTTVNESYLATLLHAVFWAKPYHVYLQIHLL